MLLTATTDAFAPIPIPKRILIPSNNCQLCTYAAAMTVENEKSAAMNRAPRRPKKYSFNGSLNWELSQVSDSFNSRIRMYEPYQSC